MNPQNHPQGSSDIRPLRKRKRLWAVGAALFVLGAIGGTQSAQDEVDAAHALAAKPVPTVTTTTTATATVTKTARSRSITSNAGNCYQAGQYCRNSDHGATTTAGGTRITCRYSSNAWRWSYS